MRSRCALAVLAALLPQLASANSAAPLDYSVTVQGTSVVTCADPYFHQHPCPDQGLLRRNVATGETVVVRTCDGQGCFLDECVPPGNYEYGLAVPFSCSSASDHTAYYGRAVATASVQACVRTQPAPAAAPAGVPWGSCQYVCQYRGAAGCPDGAGGGCSSTGPVIAFDLAVLAVGLALWSRRARRPRTRD